MTGPKAKTLRESDIEDYLVERVKKLGGEVRKVKWIGRNGAPDRVVMLGGGTQCHSLGIYGATIWVEVKASGVKPEEHQLREHRRMRDMGQHVVVVDSFQQVDRVLS